MNSFLEALKWEGAFAMNDCDRFGVTRGQFLGVIVCYEVWRPKNEFGIIT